MKEKLPGFPAVKNRFYTKNCKDLTDAEIESSSKLFSNNYGFYSSCDQVKEERRGKRIKLPPSYYYAFKSQSNYYVSFAYNGAELIGHAYYLLKANEEGNASWVVQLVVHEDFRQQGIGKRLLLSIWGFSNDVAWGLATSNPLTVKTLESATLRKVDPVIIRKNIGLINFLRKDISFMKDDINSPVITEEKSVANTLFYVSHTDIDLLLKEYSDKWQLGELEEGQEWIAFTFQEQDIVSLTKQKIDKILEYSDEILKDAYSRMEMTNHPWAKFSMAEVDFIINKLCLGNKDIEIADFGCGTGRHVFGFYNNAFSNVMGIDFSKTHIDFCKKQLPAIAGRFINADCRNITLYKSFDLILCLYDVVGSFPEEEENIRILQNIFSHLKQRGHLVLSVMNMELTNHIAKYKADIYKSPLSLVKLKAGDIMKSSGNIFNPEYFLIDESTDLIFRKEKFGGDENISAEYIIRDKRYSLKEITEKLENLGFDVIYSAYVRAGHWETSLSATDPHAKEILLIAVKK